MWLLPLFSPLARAAAGIYYRVRYDGPPAPRSGPALLVANHPNSLLDPTLVVAAAGRPVRFLAKAPLFADRKIGWLVKAAGAIPVYRRADDPSLMDRNRDAFGAVFEALATGAAVGIFPEGLSHSEPSMAPLRTGAARVALGAAAITGAAFPIIPIGLSFREKDTFRSDTFVVRGAALAWDDIALRGADDSEAVRELTARIEAALRTVTVNLESWEDRPLVECAVRIWEASQGDHSGPGERVSHLELTTRLLARLRATGDSDGLALAGDIGRHARRLSRLGLRPADLSADVRASRGVQWAARRFHLFMPLGVVLALTGAVLFWVPYQVTGVIVARLGLERDVRSTWKLLIGIVLYAAWLALLASLAGARFGLAGVVACLAGVPAVAISGLLVRERWQSSWSDARRFFLLRARRDMIGTLRQRQGDLARRLGELLERER